MEINYDNIPQELKDLPHWVNWKKKDKCPVNPKTGKNAQSNNPETWASIDNSKSYMEAHKGNGIGGIGFAFSENDSYVGIDFDHCIKDGVVDTDVDKILKSLDSYSEISPSGDGIHAIVRGELPGPGLGSEKGRVCEMYDRGRYFTFTGQRLADYGDTIRDRNGAVSALYKEMAGGATASNTTGEGVNEGTRNVSCASIAGRCLGKGMTPKATLDHCLKWNQKNSPPLPENEIRKTVKSMLRKEYRKDQETKKLLGNTSLNHAQILDALYSNEDGDALLFQRLFEDEFIFDHGAGLWAKWTGHHWIDDDKNEAVKAIEKVISVYKSALTTEKKIEKQIESKLQLTLDDAEAGKLKADIKQCGKTQERLYNRIRALQSASRKKNVLFLAGVGTGLTGNEWDTDPWLLGCQNGVIDLRWGTLHAGKQSDYIKIATDINFDAGAQCPRWEEFLSEIFDQNQELIDYVQRLFGYGITGLKSEHVLPVLYGAGRNGKGTYLETLKLVLGKLAHKTKAESLMDSGKLKASGSADADVVAMRGKRLIWASETNEGGRMNVGKIKELVGGDTLNARAPYGRRVIEFEPNHLLCLITNSKPQAPASDFALWERIALIPFNLAFVNNPKKKNERKVNTALHEELKKELPGILNWLVCGVLEWGQMGLAPPEIVKTATTKYREENDLIGDFLSETCEVSESGEVQARVLYQRYEIWCKDMGHKHYSGTRFGTEIKKTTEHEKRRNRIYYLGISLIDKDEVDPFC